MLGEEDLEDTLKSETTWVRGHPHLGVYLYTRPSRGYSTLRQRTTKRRRGGAHSNALHERRISVVHGNDPYLSPGDGETIESMQERRSNTCVRQRKLARSTSDRFRSIKCLPTLSRWLKKNRDSSYVQLFEEAIEVAPPPCTTHIEVRIFLFLLAYYLSALQSATVESIDIGKTRGSCQ